MTFILNYFSPPLAPALEQELLDTYAKINSLPEHGNFWLEDQEKWRLFITRKITRLTISEYTEKASLAHISTTCRVRMLFCFIYHSTQTFKII